LAEIHPGPGRGAMRAREAGRDGQLHQRKGERAPKGTIALAPAAAPPEHTGIGLVELAESGMAVQSKSLQCRKTQCPAKCLGGDPRPGQRTLLRSPTARHCEEALR